MPEITEITVSYSRKVQLEQFEPIEHSVELTGVVQENEDADAAYNVLAEKAEDMVERQLVARVHQKKLSEDSDDNDGD